MSGEGKSGRYAGSGSGGSNRSELSELTNWGMRSDASSDPFSPPYGVDDLGLSRSGTVYGLDRSHIT